MTPDPGPSPAQLRHRQMVSGEASPEHGTYSTYTNYLCRCSECRQANREYHRARYAERKAASSS